MIDVAFLYLFLVIFIIILLYMILLYSNYDTSVIFRTNDPTGSTLTATGNVIVATDGGTNTNIEFFPNIDFRKKRLNGKIKLVLSAQNNNTEAKFSIVDSVNNEVVADETTFTLNNQAQLGTTNCVLVFETSSLEGANSHNLEVRGTANNAIIHEAIIYYY